jgi:hypothetical protein
MIVSSAAFPLTLRALEEGGPADARAQLEISLTALLAIAALGQGAVVWLLGEHRETALLLAQVSCGVLVYTLLIFVIGIAGVRTQSLRLLARWPQQGSS